MSKPENGTMLGGSTAGPSDGAASMLLDWYDRHRRLLPWRAVPGEKPAVYRIWLSEIMLQQTKVKTVIPYFEKLEPRKFRKETQSYTFYIFLISVAN